MTSAQRIRSAAERCSRQALAPLVRFIARFPISPIQISVAGCLLSIVASIVFLWGYQITAGFIFLFASSFDLIDGSLARLTNQVTTLGQFLDSTLDRIAEGAILTSICYTFAKQGEAVVVVAVMVSLIGGFLTSYVRARAEAIGISCTIGWATRPERVAIITTGLLFNVLTEVLYILAVVTSITVIQRMGFVFARLNERKATSPDRDI